MENKTTEQITEHIKEILRTETYLKENNDGTFEGEIYADYRDELDRKSIKKICSSDNPMEVFYELFWDCYWDSYEFSYIYDLIKKHWDDKDEYNNNEGLIKEWIDENIHFNYPYDHYLKQDICINIITDTGDGNYDYTLNNFASYDAVPDEKIDNKSSILWLVKQQGYTKTQLNKVIKEQDFSDSKFLKSIYRELINVTTHMNCLVFLQKWTLREFINYKENPYDITIPVGTTCGLYDAWSGAGSILEIQLEKDIKIPKEFAQPDIDGGRGYGICEIYGVNSSLWD